MILLRLFLLVLASFLIPAVGLHAEMTRIEPFPFVAQEPEYCGPACLAMVMHHYGAAFSQEQLAREIYRKDLGGTLNLELVLAARRHGFESVSRIGNLPVLLESVAQGVPVIVQVKHSPKADIGHFLVIYGFDRDRRILLANSGREQGREIPWDEFKADWERAHFWMLEVKQRSDWP